MVKGTIKRNRYMQTGPFKSAMEELSKNKSMNIKTVERKIGLKDDFVEQVDRGIKELSLMDVIAIADFFGTTMDSVLDGGHRETRVVCDTTDELEFQYFEACMKTYAELLHDKGCNFWRTGLWSKQVIELETRLEKQEYQYMERFKTHMDEHERKHIQPKDATNCCDDVLINELVKRGFKVERCEEDGQKTYKSGR